jgi:hypothetical protein
VRPGPALSVTAAIVGNAVALLQNAKQADWQTFPQSPPRPSPLLGIGVASAVAMAAQSSIALSDDIAGDLQQSDTEAVDLSGGGWRLMETALAGTVANERAMRNAKMVRTTAIKASGE